MEDEIEEIRQRDDLRDIRDELGSYSNVQGTAIGYRIKNGKQSDEPCVFAYVPEKLREDELSDDERLPEEIKGVAIDVRAPGGYEFTAAETRTEEVRPLSGGVEIISGGNVGSMGMLVRGPNDEYCALTNRHVITGGASYTDSDPSDIIGSTVDQPQNDGSTIGSVIDCSEITGGVGYDWALIELDDSNWFTNNIFGVPEVGSLVEPSFNDRIVMSSPQGGGLNAGRLIAVDVEHFIIGVSNLVFQGNYEYRFDESFDLAGASGSAVGWIDPDTDTFHPFALNHAESGNGQNSLGIDLSTIQSQSGFTLDTGSYSPVASSPFNGTHFEGAVGHIDQDAQTAYCLAANVSDTQGSATIEIRNDGTVVDSHSTGSVAALGNVTTTMNLADAHMQVYDTTHESWNVDTNIGAVVSGTVTVDGSPADNATIEIIVQEIKSGEGEAMPELLYRTTTDSNGEYELPYYEVMEDHYDFHVIARIGGGAIALSNPYVDADIR